MVERSIVSMVVILQMISMSTVTPVCLTGQRRVANAIALSFDFELNRTPQVKFVLTDDTFTNYSVSFSGHHIIDRDLVLYEMPREEVPSLVYESIRVRQPFSSLITSSNSYFAVVKRKNNMTRAVEVEMKQLASNINVSSLNSGPIEILHSLCILNSRVRTLAVYFRALDAMSQVKLAIVQKRQRFIKRIATYDHFLAMKKRHRLPLFVATVDQSENISVVFFSDSTYTFTQVRAALSLKRTFNKTHKIESAFEGVFTEPIQAFIKMKDNMGFGFSFLIATRASFHFLDFMWIKNKYQVIVWPTLTDEMEHHYFHLLRSLERRMEKLDDFTVAGDANTGYFLLKSQGKSQLQYVSLRHGIENNNSYFKSPSDEWTSLIAPLMNDSGTILDYKRYSYHIEGKKVTVKHHSLNLYGQVVEKQTIETKVHPLKSLRPPKFIIPFSRNFGFIIYSDSRYSLSSINSAILLESPLKPPKFLTYCPISEAWGTETKPPKDIHSKGSSKTAGWRCAPLHL